MHVLELVVQGVRGFAASSRASLKPGYIVLKPGAAAAPPLCILASALLYPDGGADAALLAPGQKSGAKASLTFAGNDQVTYRVMRELGGRCLLQRQAKGATAFEKLSDDLAEVSETIRAQAGLPDKDTFEQLFTLTPAQLPSKRPKGKPQPRAAPAAPVSAAAATDPAVAAARARLAELENEQKLTEEVAKLQYRADALAGELFELEHKLKDAERVRSGLSEAEAALRVAPTPERLGLPMDIVARAEKYQTAASRRDEALARLTAEGEQEEHLGGRAEPLIANQKFWAAIGAGVLCLVIGLAMKGPARYLAFLDIPAFGFAAFLALRYVDGLQGSEEVGRRAEKRAAREKKIRDDFEAEAKPVRAAMHALGVDNPMDLIEQLSRKDAYQQRVDQLKEELAALEQDPEYVQAAEQYKTLKDESESINTQLQERNSFIRDQRDIEGDIAEAKDALVDALRAAGPGGRAASRGGTGETAEDPMPGLLSFATGLFNMEVPALQALMKDRCAQYVSALTDRRFLSMELDASGRATLVGTGKKVAAGDAPAKDLDLCYLSLRLTLIEKYATRSKVPVLMEDSLGVDEAKLSLFSRMLKHLGTLTQVIHASGHNAFGAVADLSASV